MIHISDSQALIDLAIAWNAVFSEPLMWVFWIRRQCSTRQVGQMLLLAVLSLAIQQIDAEAGRSHQGPGNALGVRHHDVFAGNPDRRDHLRCLEHPI